MKYAMILFILLSLTPKTTFSDEPGAVVIRGELAEIVPEVVSDYLYGEVGEEDFCRIAEAINRQARKEKRGDEWWLTELRDVMEDAGCDTAL